MASSSSNFSLPSSSNICNPKAVLSEDRLNFKTNAPCLSKMNLKEQEQHLLSKNTIRKHFVLTNPSTSRVSSSKMLLCGALSSTVSATDTGDIISENEYCFFKPRTNEMEFNRVNCLVWVLHESARSFSGALQTLEFARTGPLVAMAWNGVDVHAWHKHMSYQVAAYALLKAAIQVELLLSHNRPNNPSPVHKILSPKTNFLQYYIEGQLNARNPKLVEWFQMVELPRVAALFMPLFKKWSMEYAGSGVAGTITAITCCAALSKIGSGRIGCSRFTTSVEDALIELMTMANDLVSVDKLHHLASEAGFEEDFLAHFGGKILPSNNIEDIEFWIGLVQRKLSVALERESVLKDRHDLPNKIDENTLATLGLFTYLGRESRLFLSRHNIKDIDEQIDDFLSYLECGIHFIYPEISTLSMYQLLVEVIVDEIGWFDFFAAYNCQVYQEKKRRSKQYLIQAEQEIILYAVYTTCYDVISGFAHYSSSTQQAVDGDLSEFLLQSQGLLETCLEVYWAAYDNTGDLPRIGERNGPDSMPPFRIKGSKSPSLIMDARQRPDELRFREKHCPAYPESQADSSASTSSSKKPGQQNFLKKSTMKLVAASVDVWMGTQLLFVDISHTLRLLVKKLCGHKVTKRERTKMQRTFADIGTLIPVTILMLLPISAVGHAAMFAAIKKYMPCLIPSPYSNERLKLVKQLKRTKKMEIQRINVEDAIPKVV